MRTVRETLLRDSLWKETGSFAVVVVLFVKEFVVVLAHLSGAFEVSRVAVEDAAAGNVQQLAFVEFEEIDARAVTVVVAHPLLLVVCLLGSFNRSAGAERPLD